MLKSSMKQDWSGSPLMMLSVIGLDLGKKDGASKMVNRNIVFYVGKNPSSLSVCHIKSSYSHQFSLLHCLKPYKISFQLFQVQRRLN